MITTGHSNKNEYPTYATVCIWQAVAFSKDWLMGFKATLVIGKKISSSAEFEAIDDKEKYELVECEYEFYQSLDESGKPASRPQSGLIKFVMPAQGDDDLTFYNWMFNRVLPLTCLLYSPVSFIRGDRGHVCFYHIVSPWARTWLSNFHFHFPLGPGMLYTWHMLNKLL